MLSVVQAALLGAIQGIAEFLPISSTAHLLIGERLLGFDDPGSVFTEMIQLGSIMAIVWLYRQKVWEVVAGIPTRPEARRFAVTILAAFAPAILAGLVASDYVEAVLHKSVRVIALAFVAGGGVMLAVEGRRRRPSVTRIDDTSLAQGFGIGLFQVLALVPGVSRSGATIVGGLLVGLDRASAAEFSFFLAMPTMAAAFVHSAIELQHQVTVDRLAEVSVGFVTAFVASLIVVKPFLGYVRRVGFAPFAWYRIVVGLALLAALSGGLL